MASGVSSATDGLQENDAEPGLSSEDASQQERGKASLTKEDLVYRLKNEVPWLDTSEMGKPTLLAYAKSFDVITEAELKASTPMAFKTVKMYLQTMIKDKDVLEKFNEYVKAYSLLWSRSLLFLNLLVHDMTKIPFSNRESLNDVQKRFISSREDKLFLPQANKLMELLFKSGKSPMLLQQLFLPEKWTERGTLKPEVDCCYRKYAPLLSHLFPQNWKSIMMKSGWVEVALNASIITKANIGVHVRRAIVIGAKAYVKSLANDQVGFKKLLNLLQRPWPKNVDCKIDRKVVDSIYNLRDAIGLKKEEYLHKFGAELTPKMLSVFFFLCWCGFSKSNLMPKGRIGRKHCFIDNFALQFMFPSETEKVRERLKHQNINIQRRQVSLFEELGFSLNQLKTIHQIKRKKIIHEARKKGRTKTVKKWRRRGCPMFPQEAKITSIKTDGVSLCLTLSYPMKLPRVSRAQFATLSAPQPNREEQTLRRIRDHSTQTKSDPIFVGIDAGRTKLYTASILDNPYEDPKDLAFTRRMYYNQIHFKKRQKQWENRVKDNLALKSAFEELSTSKSLIDFIEKQRKHMDVLYFHLLEDKRQALANMIAWRLKCSSKAKAVNYLVRKISRPNRNTLVGIGHCVVAPTGRGEQSVSTKSICKVLDSTIKQRNKCNRIKGSVASISSVSINEHRTTLLCCDCACFTYSPFIKNADKRRRSSRLRYCPNCDLSRDRDIQASLNILRLTTLKYRQEERPPYFCRQKRT